MPGEFPAEIPVAPEGPYRPFQETAAPGEELAGVRIMDASPVSGRRSPQSIEVNEIIPFIITVDINAADLWARRADQGGVILNKGTQRLYLLPQLPGVCHNRVHSLPVSSEHALEAQGIFVPLIPLMPEGKIVLVSHPDSHMVQ